MLRERLRGAACAGLCPQQRGAVPGHWDTGHLPEEEPEAAMGWGCSCLSSLGLSHRSPSRSTVFPPQNIAPVPVLGLARGRGALSARQRCRVPIRAGTR